MNIILAKPRGFCAGVERAIKCVERALERYGAPVYVLNNIVHNQHVVEELRAKGAVGEKDNVKILTSCPSCLQGLSRYGNDLNNGLLEADYIVVEMARKILGENWMPEYVDQANAGGIERVLV